MEAWIVAKVEVACSIYSKLIDNFNQTANVQYKRNKMDIGRLDLRRAHTQIKWAQTQMKWVYAKIILI